MAKNEELKSLESEAGVIATLIQKPEYSFYSESLLPGHFTDKINACVYTSITGLAKEGISTIDPYNIIEFLNSSEATRKFADEVSIDVLNELMEMSDILARNSVEEYKMLVNNVLDAAFRRDTYARLKECQLLCCDRGVANVEQKIYEIIDDVMSEFSVNDDIPKYSEVIDECWEEIKSRQESGCAGIPFKFPTLNEYATIEKGELFIFGAEAKQGKSMMLLNCAIDLLKKNYGVLYIDSELNTRLFTARVLSHLTGIEYRRLTSGNYSDAEAKNITDAIAWMKTRNFTHVYMPIFDQQSVYTTVKKIYHQYGLQVLIIDYFKSASDGDAFASYQELGQFVDLVKNKICGRQAA